MKNGIETPEAPESLVSSIERLITTCIQEEGEQIMANTIDGYNLSKDAEKRAFMDSLTSSETQRITGEAIRGFYDGFEQFQQILKIILSKNGYYLVCMQQPEIIPNEVKKVFSQVKPLIENFIKTTLKQHIDTAFELEFERRKKPKIVAKEVEAPKRPEINEKTETPSVHLGLKTLEGMIRKGEHFTFMVLEIDDFKLKEKAYGEELTSIFVRNIFEFIQNKIRRNENPGDNDVVVYFKDGQFWVIFNKTPLNIQQQSMKGSDKVIPAAQRILDDLSGDEIVGPGLKMQLKMQRLQQVMIEYDRLEEKFRDGKATSEEVEILAVIANDFITDSATLAQRGKRAEDRGQVLHNFHPSIKGSIGCTEYLPILGKVKGEAQIKRLIQDLLIKAYENLNKAKKQEGSNVIVAE